MTEVTHDRPSAGLGRELRESALLFLLALVVTAGVAGIATLLH